jgi:hypothetical protein
MVIVSFTGNVSAEGNAQWAFVYAGGLVGLSEGVLVISNPSFAVTVSKKRKAL